MVRLILVVNFESFDKISRDSISLRKERDGFDCVNLSQLRLLKNTVSQLGGCGCKSR